MKISQKYLWQKQFRNSNAAGPATPIVIFICIFGLIASLCYVSATLAAECGGTTPCQCGDTLVSDHTMAYNIGPCPRISGEDTVGLWVKSGVTLDCQDHTITGPGDNQKDAFGIRMGKRNAPVQVSNVIIKNCEATKFWWGMYVQNSRNIVIESNVLSENGWKDPGKNGTGYGLDIANSEQIMVRNNIISDNGNEGLHLSHSTNVTVEENLFFDNGWEQVYLYFCDNNIIRHNYATGGIQGLEMRYSNNNDLSYNIWTNSKKQWLENHNNNNTFRYEHFEGVVRVTRKSIGNRFELCEFNNPNGPCLRIKANDNSVYKGYFTACNWDVRTSKLVTLDRCVNVDKVKKAKRAVLIYPGCTADFNGDGVVDGADQGIILAALPSAIGDPNWNPEGDLDHDGDVDNDDLAIFDAQLGSCPQ
jgi:parallel beta-helix repeat protein